MKEKKTVPQNVKDNLKEFTRIKKTILDALESGAKSIPEVAKTANLTLPVATYHLMSLRKYGFIIETGEINDDDYYLYQLKKKK